MGILIPSKFGLVLRANASPAALFGAIQKAATIEPTFSQRKLKYRKAPGIGLGTLSRVDPNDVAQEHNLEPPPSEAIEVNLGPIILRAWITSLNGNGAEARYICISDPKAGFAWAEALAERTAEFLTEAGFPHFQIEVLKGRG